MDETSYCLSWSQANTVSILSSVTINFVNNMFFLFFKYLFIYLAGMWDLVPRPGIKPRPPALGTQGLSHWATVKVSDYVLLNEKDIIRLHS